MVENDHITVWHSCLQAIQKQVNPQSFRTWFAPIKPVRLEEKVLTIKVPNKFFYEWLEEHYVSVLKKTLRQELGEGAKLEYLVPRSNENTTVGEGPATPGHHDRYEPSREKGGGQSFAAEQIKNPFVIPGIKKVRIPSQLNENYTLDNFIEGDCNRLARSAGIAVAKRPGETAFNPLFIFGSVGLGKTHLAHAIGNEVRRKFDDKNVLYVSSDVFTNQFIEALKNNAVQDFVNFYQLVDVLVIDDIQFLSNKQRTQEIFFHIFNHLHQNGKQLVLTSDRPPKELEGMEERLISRFKWGLSADLQTPDLETRMAILEKKMNAEGIEIPYHVAEFISFNVKSNIRELEGVLISLLAQAALNNREIDLDLARDVLRHFVLNISKEITLDFIQKVVAEHFDVSQDEMRDKTRKRNIVMARQLSMFLAKNLTNQSLKVIGEYFGGRDHSTVIHSCKAVQDMLDTDPAFQGKVQDIEKKIKLGVTEG
jgi:chromosomal replication initiator protein